MLASLAQSYPPPPTFETSLTNGNVPGWSGPKKNGQVGGSLRRGQNFGWHFRPRVPSRCRFSVLQKRRESGDCPDINVHHITVGCIAWLHCLEALWCLWSSPRYLSMAFIVKSSSSSSSSSSLSSSSQSTRLKRSSHGRPASRTPHGLHASNSGPRPRYLYQDQPPHPTFFITQIRGRGDGTSTGTTQCHERLNGNPSSFHIFLFMGFYLVLFFLNVDFNYYFLRTKQAGDPSAVNNG